MSLACLECNQIGAFDTLIVFHPKGNFDPEKPVSRYPNFYTDCAKLGDFKEVKSSRFMVVKQRGKNDSWNTGNDGPKISETASKLISEDELRKKLPKIHAALLQYGK